MNASLPTADALRDVEVERAYLKIAQKIVEFIAAKKLEIGVRLPAERALSTHFGVSRTIVREALIALEVQGVVEVRSNSGIYVSSNEPLSTSAFSDFAITKEPGPFELLNARLLIESEIAGLAAVTRPDNKLDEIYELLEQMRIFIDDKEKNEAADRAFHLRIAEATGNSVLLQMVTSLWDKLRGPLWSKTDEHFHTNALRLQSLADHQKIFSALLSKDAIGAKAAMNTHLDRVIHQFARTWRQVGSADTK